MAENEPQDQSPDPNTALPPGADGSGESGAAAAYSPGASTGNEGGEGGGIPSPPEPVPPRRVETPEHLLRRINKLTARNKELSEELTRKGAATAGGPPASAPPGFVPLEAVSVEAERIALAREFGRQCETAISEGREKFEDFDSRVQNLRTICDDNDPREVAAYNGVLSALFETGRSAELIHSLGAKPSEMERLMSLRPMQLAMEVTKMTQRLETPSEPSAGDLSLSRASPPIRPIASRGPAHTAIAPDDLERGTNLDMATWMARRQAQIEERKKSVRGLR